MKTVIDKFLKLHHLSQEEYVELLQYWDTVRLFCRAEKTLITQMKEW